MGHEKRALPCQAHMATFTSGSFAVMTRLLSLLSPVDKAVADSEVLKLLK